MDRVVAKDERTLFNRFAVPQENGSGCQVVGPERCPTRAEDYARLGHSVTNLLNEQPKAIAENPDSMSAARTIEGASGDGFKLGRSG